MIVRVVCYGDSNTWGFDPRSYFGSRYERSWVSILAEETGWEVLNLGFNGAQIPRAGIEIPPGTDLLILMLGTNDLLQGSSVQEISLHMEAFLLTLDFPPEKMLLLVPPPLMPGEWVSDRELISRSRQLADHYRRISKARKIPCADAGQWGIGLCFDGVHFTENGHLQFAKNLLAALSVTTP